MHRVSRASPPYAGGRVCGYSLERCRLCRKQAVCASTRRPFFRVYAIGSIIRGILPCRSSPKNVAARHRAAGLPSRHAVARRGFSDARREPTAGANSTVLAGSREKRRRCAAIPPPPGRRTRRKRRPCAPRCPHGAPGLRKPVGSRRIAQEPPALRCNPAVRIAHDVAQRKRCPAVASGRASARCASR